jgi:predicted nucleic acid-binding protein
LITSGQLVAVDLISEDWERCAELVERYANLRLDLVDASLIAIAERPGHSRLATLNYRDFAAVRPKHVDAFTLLP